MSKKPGMGLELHKLTGKMLYGNREYLITLLCQLSPAYGNTHRVVRRAEKAIHRLDDLRFELDSCVWREHPEMANKDVCHIYYPGRESHLPGQEAGGEGFQMSKRTPRPDSRPPAALMEPGANDED